VVSGGKQHDQRAILAQLAAMRASGEISADEHQAARERILGPDAARIEPPPPPQSRRQVLREKPEKQAQSKAGCGTIVVAILVILVLVSIFSGHKSTDPVQQAADASSSAEDHRKGFHCLSAWDGSDPQLVDAVKGQMREPSSFEHVETRITPVDSKGHHTVFMTFRGRNGFGGMNVETAVGTISNSTCALIDFNIIEN